MRKKLGKPSSRSKGPPRMGRAGRIPEIKPGRYADGMPFNEVQYLECKIILRPNHFTSRKSFFDFAKVMRRPAAEAGVDPCNANVIHVLAQPRSDRPNPNPIRAEMSRA